MFVSRKLISIQLFARFVRLLNLKRLPKRTFETKSFDGFRKRLNDGSSNLSRIPEMEKSIRVKETSKQKYLPLHYAIRNFCANRSSNFILVAVNVSAINVTVASVNCDFYSGFNLSEG